MNQTEEPSYVLFLFSAMSWNPSTLLTLAFDSYCRSLSSRADALDQARFEAKLRQLFGGFETALASRSINSQDVESQWCESEEQVKEKMWLMGILSNVVKPNDAVRRSLQLVHGKKECGLYISGKYPPLQPLLLQVHRVGLIVQCFRGAELDNVANKMWPCASDPPPTWATLDGTVNSKLGTALLAALSEAHDPMSVAYVSTAGRRWLVKIVVPLVDDDTYDMSPHFDEWLWNVVRHVVEKEKCSVLFHCSAGMHRSATMLAAYLLHEQVASLLKSERRGALSPPQLVEDVIATIQAARKFARPTAVAVQQLVDYTSRLIGV